MHASWFRRTARGLACAGALALLAACGSGSVVSNLQPKRFITVGDSFMDVGQSGTLYTVNYALDSEIPVDNLAEQMLLQ